MADRRTTSLFRNEDSVGGSVKFMMALGYHGYANIAVELMFLKIPAVTHDASNYITEMADYVSGYIDSQFDIWTSTGRKPTNGEVDDLVVVLGDRLEHHYSLETDDWLFFNMSFNGLSVNGKLVREMLAASNWLVELRA